jgi:imidazolonepropionase-like amidohydrolase
LCRSHDVVLWCARGGQQWRNFCSGISSCSNPRVGELQGGFELLVEGETVREVSDKPIKAPGADVIDCGGRTLMPGLIDSHVHVT